MFTLPDSNIDGADKPSHNAINIDRFLELASLAKASLLAKSPPVKEIAMPTKMDLLKANHTDLIEWIECNGGFGAVAERLGMTTA